jgi:ABC-type molybdate transport system substrate-binding protein
VKTVPLPAWAQPPIRYEIAVVKGGREAAARAFVTRVIGKVGRTALRKAGFGLPKR